MKLPLLDDLVPRLSVPFFKLSIRPVDEAEEQHKCGYAIEKVVRHFVNEVPRHLLEERRKMVLAKW